MNKTILNKINCLKLSMSFSVYFIDKGEKKIGEVEEGGGRENREQRWRVDGEEQGCKVEKRTKKGGR